MDETKEIAIELSERAAMPGIAAVEDTGAALVVVHAYVAVPVAPYALKATVGVVVRATKAKPPLANAVPFI